MARLSKAKIDWFREWREDLLKLDSAERLSGRRHAEGTEKLIEAFNAAPGELAKAFVESSRKNYKARRKIARIDDALKKLGEASPAERFGAVIETRVAIATWVKAKKGKETSRRAGVEALVGALNQIQLDSLGDWLQEWTTVAAATRGKIDQLRALVVGRADPGHVPRGIHQDVFDEWSGLQEDVLRLAAEAAGQDQAPALRRLNRQVVSRVDQARLLGERVDGWLDGLTEAAALPTNLTAFRRVVTSLEERVELVPTEAAALSKHVVELQMLARRVEGVAKSGLFRLRDDEAEHCQALAVAARRRADLLDAQLKAHPTTERQLMSKKAHDVGAAHRVLSSFVSPDLSPEDRDILTQALESLDARREEMGAHLTDRAITTPKSVLGPKKGGKRDDAVKALKKYGLDGLPLGLSKASERLLTQVFIEQTLERMSLETKTKGKQLRKRLKRAHIEELNDQGNQRAMAGLEDAVANWLGRARADGAADALTARIPAVERLWAQVQQIWGDRSYMNEGQEPYKMPTRLSVLAYELGLSVAFNCKSGKDRTGQLDVEVKLMAGQLAAMGAEGLPAPDTQLDQAAKDNVAEITVNSGNHEMQQLNTGCAGYKLKGVGTLKARMGGPGREAARVGISGATSA